MDTVVHIKEPVKYSFQLPINLERDLWAATNNIINTRAFIAAPSSESEELV